MTDTLATREAFEGLSDVGAPLRLHVKAWGKDVFLLDPTADVRDEWEKFTTDSRAKEGSAPWRAKVAQLLLCDESGKRLFSEDDLEFLGARNPAAMTEVFTAGMKRLAITDEEIAAVSGN